MILVTAANADRFDPVGATGARILTTLSREMDRRGVRYRLETMCIGGGQGLGAVLEWVA